jgi:cobalt-zinc-cadmium efflux system protein
VDHDHVHDDHVHDDHVHDSRHGSAQHQARRQQRSMQLAMGLNGAIVVVQVVAGILAHSVGLIADAGHNLGDVAGLAVAVVATRLATRAPSPRRSFGLHRAGVLAAQANGVSILVLSGIVIVESIRRFGTDQAVDGAVVAVVAGIAVVVNLLAVRVVHPHAHDLNTRAAMLHLVGDAAASAAVVVAGTVIWATDGWRWLDPGLAIVIAVVIGVGALRLLARTTDVLLQSTPEHVDATKVHADLHAIEGVLDVHDLHVWALTDGMDVASAHLVVRSGTDMHRVLDAARDLLADRHRLTHATLQVEPEDHTGCEELAW